MWSATELHPRAISKMVPIEIKTVPPLGQVIGVVRHCIAWAHLAPGSTFFVSAPPARFSFAAVTKDKCQIGKIHC